MKIIITDEAHNRVDWVVRTPLLRILLGILVGWGIFTALVITSPSPLRWPMFGTVSGIVVMVILILAFTTPVREKGHLERTIDGGDVQRIKGWLRRKKVALIEAANPNWADLSEGWFD